MRQISQSYRTGELSVVDVAPPRAPSGGILVQTTASLISAGTERTIVELAKKSLVGKARERPDLVAKVLDKVKREGALAAFDAVRSKLDSPIPLGYSLAGRVLEAGASAREFARGDRVACAGAGFANHADLNAVPKNLAVRVPDAVTDEEAAFVTVGAIALHGARLLKASLGDVVAVVGLGLLGQIAVSLLVAQGCDVVGIDVDRGKVERALARGAVAGGVIGADDCVELARVASRGRGVDGVLVTASSPTNDPLVLAGEIARDRARVSVVGLMPLEIPRKAYYEKELSVVVSRSYGPGRYDPDYEERGQDYPIGYVRWTERRNLEAVLRAIETKRLDVKSLVTHRFPFERALDAYDLITGVKPEPHLGVVLTYADAARIAAVPPAPVERRARRGGSLGVAVVGTGSFATGVLLPQLQQAPGAKLVATVSGRGLSARHAADRFGAARVAASLDEVLASDDIDVVVIATRHAAHADQAARVLATGRDVFLEKPAALDEEQLTRLGEAVRGSSGRLLVGFNRRFSPFARQVADVFASRRAGLVMTARINAGRVPAGSWIVDAREGGGRIIGEGCHFVDLLSFWAGSPPVRVTAHAIGGGGGAYEGHDNVVVGLGFADGSVGTITYTSMGDASLGKESYELFCEGTVCAIDDWRTLSVTSRGKTRKQRALRADKGHAEEVRAFLRACARGEESPIAWGSIEATTRATFAVEVARGTGAGVEL